MAERTGLVHFIRLQCQRLSSGLYGPANTTLRFILPRNWYPLDPPYQVWLGQPFQPFADVALLSRLPTQICPSGFVLRPALGVDDMNPMSNLALALPGSILQSSTAARRSVACLLPFAQKVQSFQRGGSRPALMLPSRRPAIAAAASAKAARPCAAGTSITASSIAIAIANNRFARPE